MNGFGVIVEDFGDSAGHAVIVGNTRIADPSRRWAIKLDDETLMFADPCQVLDSSKLNIVGAGREGVAAGGINLAVGQADTHRGIEQGQDVG